MCNRQLIYKVQKTREEAIEYLSRLVILHSVLDVCSTVCLNFLATTCSLSFALKINSLRKWYGNFGSLWNQCVGESWALLSANALLRRAAGIWFKMFYVYVWYKEVVSEHFVRFLSSKSKAKFIFIETVHMVFNFVNIWDWKMVHLFHFGSYDIRAEVPKAHVKK